MSRDQESSMGALALSGRVQMTRQQLADMALIEHRAGRQAASRGDMKALARHANELSRLVEASQGV